MAGKIKHDRELERLAKAVMKLPFNREGSDKGNLMKEMFRSVRKIRVFIAPANYQPKNRKSIKG